MNSMWSIFIELIILIQITLVLNFNVDLHTYVRHRHQPGSMYGFSIAMHKTTEKGAVKSWLIIGAPKANITNEYYNTRPGLVSPGVVFRCHVDADDRCQPIPFDQHGNTLNQNNEQIDTKSNQWFGATVASGGIDKPIVACAPRYVFHGMTPSKVERIEPVGTCFIADNFQTYREYSPCRTNFWGYHRQGYCQAGFSAVISQAGDRLFIGAPGSWYWQGQVYSINTKSEFPYKPGYYQPFGNAGQIYSLDPTIQTSQVYSTRESFPYDDDSYLGYSMTAGRLTRSDRTDVAVGMPRGANLLGKVVIYSWTMENLYNITGKQIGAYFGYALCAVDVNGDNLDDLIIGAPMYTEPNNDGKYDIGRIYIVYQGFENKYEEATFRDGFRSRGRFGMALTSLSDINKDGYNDFAVGAPYDGRIGDGGAVYIYHGSKTGPSLKPTQTIYAEDLYSPHPRTFGFSLSGGMDLDGNSYPDLAVGAYESDTVFFFKSRPVISVNSDMKFLSYKSHNEIRTIDIEKQKDCVKNFHSVACAELRLCINFDSSKFLHNPNLVLDVTFKLDSKAKIPRMVSADDSNIIKTKMPLQQGCLKDTYVFITSGIQDKLTPIEVDVEYDIIDISRNGEYLRRDPRELPPPIVDKKHDAAGRKATINIQKNCGDDNVCTPDLKLAVSALDKYVLDDKKRLNVNVSITNKNEDAFETKFYMTIPKGLEYTRIENLKGGDVQVICTASITDSIIKCDIGNPFKSNSIANFTVDLHVVDKKEYPPSYDFYMEVNSTNPEYSYTTADNVRQKVIKLVIETDFNIEGNSPSLFGYYKAENYKKYDDAQSEHDLGPEVIHAYNFRNNGSAEIGQIIIAIAVPTRTLSDKPLMYVLNNPELYGNIKCNQIPRANEKNLALDPELSIKSYLAQIGAISSQGDRKSSEHAVTTHSSHHSTNVIHQTQNRVYTNEERRQNEQDDNRDSPGDASETHSQRANQASSTYSSSVRRTNLLPSAEDSLNRAAQGGDFRAQTIYLGSPELGQGGHEYQNKFQTSYPDSSQGVYGRGGYQNSGEYYSGSGYRGGSGPIRSNYSYSTSWHRGSDRDSSTSDHQRGKRQAVSKSEEEEALYTDLRSAVNCSLTHCFLMECEISRLGSKEDAWISLRTRLVAETLSQIATNIPINISTMAAAAIKHPPYRTDKVHKTVVKTREIVYTANPEPEPKEDIIPLWVVVLSACAGTLILLLLAFLLYKCGFFRRNRPSDASERQPLNRGNYHGDEHL